MQTRTTKKGNQAKLELELPPGPSNGPANDGPDDGHLNNGGDLKESNTSITKPEDKERRTL